MNKAIGLFLSMMGSFGRFGQMYMPQFREGTPAKRFKKAGKLGKAGDKIRKRVIAKTFTMRNY